MVPTEYSGSVNIFFVLHQRIQFVRRDYNNLHTKIQELRSSSVNQFESWLVLMGDAPLVVNWPWMSIPLIHGEPKCDLGLALRSVQDLLKCNPAGKSMVFVWCVDGLGGDWQGPISELVKMPGVSVVVMANQASQPEDGVFLRSLRYCTYMERIAGNFVENVDQYLKDFRKTGTVPAPPAAASASNAPQVPLLIAANPPAATVGSTEDPAQPKVVLQPSFQSMETVQSPLPLSAVENGASPASVPQPAPALTPPETEQNPGSDPPPAAVITEYPDLSNGKLDELMGPHSVPKTEAQTQPGPQQNGKSTPTQPPAGPEIVIDVSGIQANPVNLEKSPAPEPKPKNKPEPRLEPEPVPGPAKDGPVNLWAELDPPADQVDRFDPEVKKKFMASDGWSMVAASRRGKMHAHKALFREDAFALGEAAGWHFMVVADGGGSRPLARVGSNLAAEVAVNTMCENGRKLEITEYTPEEICKELLEKGMRTAYEALQQEAGKRRLKLDDFGTTFLALAHKWLPGQKRHIVGVLQVGDGLIAAQLANKTVQVLANADVGESASQTLFLTSRPWKDWLDRITLIELEAEALMFASLCDGVSDDLIPYPRNLPRFFEFMQDIALKASSDDALLEFLKYEMRGSFDDRTIALLFRDALIPPAGNPSGQSAMVRLPGEFGEGNPGSPADLPEVVEKHLD